MAKSSGSRWARSLSLGLLLSMGTAGTGCVDDPDDPKMWIKKLDDPREQQDAIRNLERLATSEQRPANIGDAVDPLIKLFKRSKSPQHLKALSKMRSEAALDTLIEQLEYSEESYDNAAVAATGIYELAMRDAKGQEAAKKAVPGLSAGLEKKLPIRTRANLVKLEIMKALYAIKDRAAVPAFQKVVETPDAEQDFFLNKEAARYLAEFADPQSVPVLVRGLFVSGRGGDVFVSCQLGLVRIGEASIEPIVQLMNRQNKEVEEAAKKQNFPAGLIVQKAAIVLGELRAKKAVPALLKELEKKDDGMAADCFDTKIDKDCVSGHQSVLQSLGLINDPAATKTLMAYLSDTKRPMKLRSAAAEALNLMNVQDAMPLLLTAAKTPWWKPAKEKGGPMEIDSEKAGFAVGAATQAGRLAMKDESATFDPLVKALPKELKESDIAVAMLNAVSRMEVAKQCGKDAACYGKVLDDMAKAMDKKEEEKSGKSDEAKVKLDIEKAGLAAKAEKAAFMLGRLPREAALPLLAKFIGYKESAARITILLGLTRLANKNDKDLLTQMQAQIAVDRSKDKTAQELAEYIKRAAAVISNQ